MRFTVPTGTSFAREALPLIKRQGEVLAEIESLEQERDNLVEQIDNLDLREGEKAWIHKELAAEDGDCW